MKPWPLYEVFSSD